METVRATFSKTGRLKYISHLDIIRCISRVFSRCELPIWFTQGFNPHPYLTFALPLPLGFDSCCETFDFRLTEPVDFDVVRDRLNAVLPEDLRIIRVAAPVEDPMEICWADYCLSFYDDMPELADQLKAFLAQENILVTKKTKKGEKKIDLKEYLTNLSTEVGQGYVKLLLRLPAGGTLNVNPTLLEGAFIKFLGREIHWVKMERLAIFDKDFNEFL